MISATTSGTTRALMAFTHTMPSGAMYDAALGKTVPPARPATNASRMTIAGDTCPERRFFVIW